MLQILLLIRSQVSLLWLLAGLAFADPLKTSEPLIPVATAAASSTSYTASSEVMRIDRGQAVFCLVEGAAKSRHVW